MTDIVDTVRQGIAKFTHETACGIIGVETLAVQREVLEKLCDEIEKLRSQTKREWVGLTDEERNQLWRDVVKWGDPSHDDVDLMKAIEAKLKEKNCG